jgi:hypothetical protein
MQCFQETDTRMLFRLREESVAPGTNSVAETWAGASKPNFVLPPEYSGLINRAWRISAKAANPGVARQARSLLLLMQDTVSSFEQMGFDIGSLPPFKAIEGEDESMLIEWIFTNYRVGFTVEVNPEESGWYLISNQALGEIGASGHLLNSNIEKTFLWLLNFVLANK